jgi:hypothetical protein
LDKGYLLSNREDNDDWAGKEYLHVILKGSVVSGDDVKQMHVGTGSKSGG